MSDHLDFVACTLDEIALEGLDGITIEGLWLRLSNRPNFPLALDENSKSYLWECIKCCEDIDVYLLAEPRRPLQLYNRFDFFDPEQDILKEPVVFPIDIYPIVVIDDIDKGIRGSCSTYGTRQLITESSKAWGLQEAVEQYSTSLVLVASQSLRNKTIFGCNVNPAKDLTAKEFVMLERIGRSRYHGEITQGKQSLSVAMNEPIKSIFYHRKVLSKMGLITKQVFSQHNSKGQTSTGSLFHLPRFFVEYVPKSLYYIREGIRLLLKTENHRMVASEFVTRLGNPYKVRKVAKSPEFKQHIQGVQVLYREMFPEAEEKEWKYKNCRHRENPEKTVRVYTLVNPQGDFSSVFGYQDDIGIDDDEDEEGGYAGILDDKNVILNKSLLSQAYEFALRCGSDGCTQREVGQHFGCNKLDARTLCRNLIKRKLVVTVLKDAGKQRVTRYVCKVWEGVSKITNELLEQKQKLLDQFRLPEQVSEESNCLQAGPSSYKSPDKDSSSLSELSPSDSSKCVIQNVVNFFPGDSKHDQKKSNALHINNPGSSLRVLKRANLVLEHVRENKVTTTMDLMKYLNNIEKSEGVESKMDRKSLFRVLKNLESDGYVRNYKAVLKYGSKEKMVQLVTDYNLKKDDELLKLIIEQEKLKLFLTPQNPKKPRESFWDKSLMENSQNSDGWSNLSESLKESAMQNVDKNEDDQTAPIVYSPGWGRFHGYLPKFSRMGVIHQLMFYLVYDYNGDIELNQTDAVQDIVASLSYNANCKLDDLPKVFNRGGGWKTFIPPLPKHEGYGKGWILYSDILLRIPLSMLAQCVLINYKISGLEEYLEHPINKHLLLCQLPAPLRHAVVLDHKYKFTLFEVIQNLSFIGLVQLGPRVLKRKEMVFFYLNRHAVLYNTSVSQPGMHHVTKTSHYPKLTYTFSSLKDVDLYWWDLNRICQDTPLGKWLIAVGQKVIIIPPMKKPELHDVLKSVSVDQAPLKDKGFMPGDKLGAACTDSSLFAYRRDNWVFHSEKKNRKNLNQIPRKTDKRNQEFVQHLKAKYKDQFSIIPPESSKEQDPDFVYTNKRKRKRKTEDVQCKEKKPGKKSRVEYTVHNRNKKVRAKPDLDDMDKIALAMKKKPRFTFTSDEDSFLVICKSALVYLFGSDLVYDHFKIRDIFNKVFKDSLKTTKTLQRRISFMMKYSPNVPHSVALIVGSLNQDKEMKEKFGQYVGKAKSKKEGLEVMESILEDLVFTIQRKFREVSHVNKKSSIELPDDVDIFRETFHIYDPTVIFKKKVFKGIQNVVDIHSNLVRTVIISSLCSFGDKTNWTYHIFWIYLQYPDSLLRSVMAKLKKDEMVSLKKSRTGLAVKKTNASRTYLPLSNSPYKLSVRFQQALVSVYQYWTYNQAYLVFKKLVSESINCKGVDLTKFNFGGNAALMLEMIATKKIILDIDIPDHILYLDTSSCKKEVMDSMWFMKFLRSIRSENAAQSSGTPMECSSNTPVDSDILDEDNTAEVSTVLKSIPSKIKITRKAVLDIREESTKQSLPTLHCPSINRFLEIYSCTVHGRLTDDIIAIENNPDKSTHLIPHNTINELVLTKVNYVLQDDALSEVEKALIDLGHGEVELASMKKLYEFISSKKEIGARLIDLKGELPIVEGKLRVYQLLEILIERQMIVRSGTIEFHYIASKFSKPWLVNTYRMKRLEREKAASIEAQFYDPSENPDMAEIEVLEVGQTDGGPSTSTSGTSMSKSKLVSKRLKKLVMTKDKKDIMQNLDHKRNESIWISIKPWIRVDGTMNRRVLDTFLGSTLGYVMQFPGSTVLQIGEMMSSAIYPVHVAELLEMLEKIGCVKSEKYVIEVQNTFFGGETLRFVGKDMTDEEFYNHVTVYEATTDAVTKMGYFVGDKKYLIDFLDSFVF